MKKKKYCYIRTFGCQMNVHDSNQMMELLEKRGYEGTEDITRADLIIVNTCSVREKAEQKIHSFLGRLRKDKKKNPDLVIGIAGCVAQQWGKNFLDKVHHLDFVIGTHNIHRLPEIVEDVEASRSRIAETTFHKSVQSLGILTLPKNGEVNAFVTIMQGCNNFCAYCIVPYLRGREESRESSEILDEIRELAAHGVKEVTLLGQNVNSYGNTLKNGPDFPTLLAMINGVEGIERIRFTTSHPKDLSDGLIESFASLEKLCEHIHLPIQSGSDSVLERMRRGYTSGDYLEKVEKLRARCPDISITTDIIVGFPGESDGDFQKTVDLMGKVRFDNLFSFKYSDRPGIASAGYSEKIGEDVKRERLAILQKLQESHTLEKNRALEGKEDEVLIEGASKGNDEEITGRTRTNRIVNLPGESSMKGKTVPVKIVRAYMHSLRGELLPGKEV
ncbi:MAG: tRNA (N6-isopentenyl adenosine(37)-C2)-methylthiotransferase MiaB [Deltaproteobacteria bacterium]|nr:tRNA (N6-isopentenyl adenosine(37)-C2)-methylthiotransferase MiaB [Deltaproteobacteria bacterium]